MTMMSMLFIALLIRRSHAAFAGLLVHVRSARQQRPLCCLSAENEAPKSSLMVPRISLGEFLEKPNYDEPVLIHDIVLPETIETLAENLIDLLGEEEVQMQRRTRIDNDEEMSGDGDDTTTEIYDLTLRETVEYMMDSSHDDAFFTCCEGLLDSSPLISEQLTQIREAPFANTENWFDYFPPSIRPTDAVILAGEGATSTFHRDPFEWTGTSICLEGTKVWRFIWPLPEDKGGVAVVDEALGSYRLDSIAWSDNNEDSENDGGEEGAESLVLSAGWQSDMSLYESRSVEAPSAVELLELEEDSKDAYVSEIESMGRDPSYLGLSQESSSALHALTQKQECNTEEPGFGTAVQRAGDLLLIPAHFWHQTYAPVPSIAVASQRCGAAIDGARVVGHVLSMLEKDGRAGASKIPDMLHREIYEEGTGKEVADALFEYLATITKI